jgi:secretory phospholipase A2
MLVLLVSSFVPFVVISALECSSDQIVAQNNRRQLISLGCIQPHLRFIPSIQDFTFCCDQHHACSRTCGTTKNYCDEDFKFCLQQLCYMCQSVLSCEFDAEALSSALNFGGFESFHELQDEYCVCSQTSGLHEFYLGLITSFYEKYVDEKKDPKIILDSIRDQSPRLNPENMRYAKLYYNLHKKYRKSIKHSILRENITFYPVIGSTWNRSISAAELVLEEG